MARNFLTDILMVFVLWVKKIVTYLFVPRSMRFKNVCDDLVLVTGGGSGIGRLMAQLFAAKGSTVIIWDLNQEGLLETCKLIQNKGGKCHAFICDVSKREEVYAAAEKIKRDIGRVTILINNAGIVSGSRFHDLPDEKIIKTMEVNTLAHFWTLKAFLPDMKKANHGHLVCIASYAGLIGAVSMSDYCASKFAAVGLAESISLELATDGYDGVKSTIVCPFLINTGLFAGASAVFGVPTLDQTETAEAIFESILLDQPLLILPKTLYLTNFLKGLLPCEAQHRLVFALEAHKCMATFTGRKGAGDDTSAALENGKATSLNRRVDSKEDVHDNQCL